jgi:hypothetical protein
LVRRRQKLSDEIMFDRALRTRYQPPAKRRDHQPLRRGRSALSLSPVSVMTGCEAGEGGWIGAG